MGIGEREDNPRNLEGEEGSLKFLTNKDPETSAPNPKQGTCQKLRSSTVPLPYVLFGAAISVTVIIIQTALLTGKEKTPEIKVEEGSPAAQCMDDWVLHGGTCYYLSNQNDTWNNSQNFCKSHNSSLAIINNEKELNFLNLLKQDYWIGLSRTKDDTGWVWINGTFYLETMFTIDRKPTESGESESVFLNKDSYISTSGRYKKKYICSKRL